MFGSNVEPRVKKKMVPKIGAAFLVALFSDSGRWMQTSYNGNLRGHYAGPGFIYDETIDAFLPPEEASDAS